MFIKIYKNLYIQTRNYTNIEMHVEKHFCENIKEYIKDKV